MNTKAQTLLDAAMELPDDERAELAAILADSLGDGSSPTEIEMAWLAEARRRLDAVRSGQSEVIASEDVERELDEIVAAAGESRRAV